eukprot:COSAG06_NODE_3293_length_5545_cov_27.493573_1_plen_220_part_00
MSALEQETYVLSSPDTHPHTSIAPIQQHSSQPAVWYSIVRNRFAISSAHDEPGRHRRHAPLDCLIAQIHVYLPGRFCQHRLPHPDHTTRTHSTLEANQSRALSNALHTQRGAIACTQTASQHALQETERYRSKTMRCQHSSKRLTPCPHQRRTHTHTPIPPVQQHNQPANKPCGCVRCHMTHSALEANRRRCCSQQHPYTQRGATACTQTASQHALQET